MNEVDEGLYREYEKQLDCFHETLPLWARSRSDAICAVMSIPDTLFLSFLHRSIMPDEASLDVQVFKGWEEGVSYSVRWLTSDGIPVLHGVSDKELIGEAYSFAQHAAQYSLIADFHMAYERGWATVHVDQSTMTVTFDRVQGPGPGDAVTWHDHVRERSEQGAEFARRMRPAGTGGPRKALLGIKHWVEDGHISLGEFDASLVNLCHTVFESGRQAELMPLPLDADMLGFSMRDFWSFARILHAWSLAVFVRYAQIHPQGVLVSDCHATQVVHEDEFIQRIVSVGDLREECVRAILDRLTLCPSPKADVQLTPFIRWEGGVCWSPTTVINYNHERNLLKVMSRGRAELGNQAATLNGRRSRVLGGLIGREFNKTGYQYKLDTAIEAGGETTDVDVLLYHTGCPEEVLVVEAKAVIGPDEVNEVYEVTQTLVAAQNQVRRVIRILNAMQPSVKLDKFKFVDWKRVSRICGVVVSSYGWPHATMDLREVPVLAFEALRRSFRRRDFRSPRRFVAACGERLWTRPGVSEKPGGHQSIKVGAVTYSIPISTLTLPKA